MSIESRLKAYLDEKVIREREGLSTEESLLDAGIIDSTGILELVDFIESTFGVEIQDEEIVPEHFETITAITSFVSRKVPG